MSDETMTPDDIDVARAWCATAPPLACMESSDYVNDARYLLPKAMATIDHLQAQIGVLVAEVDTLYDERNEAHDTLDNEEDPEFEEARDSVYGDKMEQIGSLCGWLFCLQRMRRRLTELGLAEPRWSNTGTPNADETGS